jgi:PAS domain S-box-containing protein
MPIHQIQFQPLIHESALYTCILIDRNGHYQYTNQRFRDLLGIAEIDHHTLDKVIHYADLEFFRKRIEECFSKPFQKLNATIRYLTREQSSITIQWELNPIIIEEQPYTMGIGTILSGDPLEEFSASRYVHQFNEYLDGVNDGFFALNRNWEFMRVNTFFEKVTGKSRQEMIGRKFWDLFPDDPSQPYAEAMRRAFNTNHTITFEQPWPPDYYFAVSATPSKEGIICYFIDITLQQKQQMALIQNEIKLKAILDSTTDANVLISPDMHILNFNRTAGLLAKQFLDYELTIGCKLTDFLDPDLMAPFSINFQRSLNGEKILSERPIAPNNGDSQWFELLYYPVYNEREELLGVAMNITNINARKVAEMKLLQQYDKMREIAYLQSHEARAPLSNILGLINVLALNLEKNHDPETIEILEHLRNSSEKLDSVIQKIVSNTRYE